MEKLFDLSIINHFQKTIFDLVQMQKLVVKASEHPDFTEQDKRILKALTKSGVANYKSAINQNGLPSFGINAGVNAFDKLEGALINKCLNGALRATTLNTQYINQVYKADVNNTVSTPTTYEIYFNCLSHASVNIKNYYNLEQIENLVKNGKVILLSVNKKKVPFESLKGRNAQNIDIAMLNKYSNGFIANHLAPKICEDFKDFKLNKMQKFSKKMPNYKTELFAMWNEILGQSVKQITKQQQAVIEVSLEKQRKELERVVKDYQIANEKCMKFYNFNDLILGTSVKLKTAKIGFSKDTEDENFAKSN